MSDEEECGKLDLRIHVKAKHAILDELAEKCGGVKYAAAQVGVSAATYGGWLNLRWAFRVGHRSSVSYKRQKKIICNLERLTGRNIREIFPFATIDLKPLAAERVYDRTVEKKALQNYAEHTAERLTYAPSNPDSDALIDATSTALSALSDRERTIVAMHLGLENHKATDLLTIAKELGITRSMVRQIYNRAISSLKHPNIARELVDFID